MLSKPPTRPVLQHLLPLFQNKFTQIDLSPLLQVFQNAISDIDVVNIVALGIQGLKANRPYSSITFAHSARFQLCRTCSSPNFKSTTCFDGYTSVELMFFLFLNHEDKYGAAGL